MPRGGTLIFSHIRRPGPFLRVKILNYNILDGFQENEYFLGYEEIVDIFFFFGGGGGGHRKAGLF